MANAPASVTRLFNDARTRLPGAIDDALKRELFTVLDEFFQDTNCWREDIDVDVDPDNTSYDLDSPSYGKIHRLMWTVNADGSYVYPTLSDDLSSLELETAPGQEETWTATVAVTVKDPVTRDSLPLCPSWAMDKYRTGILDGLLGRMMSQPSKPYTSERLAVLHLRRFQAIKSRARIESTHEQTYRKQAWVFPRFA